MTNERYLEGSEELQEQMKERELAAVRQAANVRQCDDPRYAEWDHEHCIDCDVLIPALRLEMGCVRCVQCQEEVDDWSRRPR